MNRESVSLLNRHEASSNEGSGSNSENEMDRAVDTEFFNEFKPDNIDRFNDILKNNIRYIFVKFIIASNVLYVFHKYNTDVLTEADILDVKYSMEGKGRIVAAELLLDRLVVYKGWFHCLIQVLRDPDVKLTHVANEMEKIKDVLCIKFPESRQLTKDTHAAEIPINDATVSSTLQADYLDDVAELDILQENVVSLSDVFTSDFFTTTLTLVVRNRLVIDGNHFTYNGKRIFLSGGNLPWISYGYDFGDGQFQNIKSQMEEQLKKLFEAGGNSMRLWIHVQGETSPAFDSKGMVTGLDTKGTFIDDFKELLSLALQYNILLFPTLWNAAVDQDPHHRLDGLLKDPNKLKSYINNALTPLVKAVSGHPALGGWDIMNEPEGMLNPEVKNEDPCFNTTSLRNSGVGWVVKKYDYKQILRFLNWQAAAIKDVDTKNIVSVGVWNPKSNTDQFGMFDFYSDSCLVKGGGKPL
ncbi:mannan endo-1 4-beta-mannosidase, partial [Biomphalaria pfeifferi]